MDIQGYLQIISGTRRGVWSAALRGGLWALSVPWAAASWCRHRAFDWGWKRVERVSVPVIAVGNLTTGGTGKTPIVACVVQQLQAMGRTPGIVSRGYGADESGENDEKRVLQQLCPHVPHEQHPDRILASRRLISEGVDVIVLDDAYQHRRIHRDLNILLIDATCPFGYGHQLPRGLLRESVSGLRRADVVLITRADRISPGDRAALRATVQQIAADSHAAADQPCFDVSFQPTQLQSATGQRLAADDLAQREVTVMTAIGNPAAFVQTCRQLGFVVAAERLFPDHHLYTADDVRQVLSLADQAQTQTVLTTLKDLVKLPPTEDRFLAVLIETVFAIERDGEAFGQCLARVLDNAEPR